MNCRRFRLRLMAGVLPVIVLIIFGLQVRGDSFVFEWWVLTGDFSTLPVYLDLNGDPVPQKVWGATGEVTGTPEGDFPQTEAWLEANYGTAQGFDEVTVTFEFGTADTSSPWVFELDPSSFSNDPANGTARITYLPAGGAPSMPVSFYAGGLDSGGNATVQLVAQGRVTELKMEMNPGLGWAGYGIFYLDSKVAASGPVTGTDAPLFEEVAALDGGSGPYRMPITIGGFDEDPAAFAEWQVQYPSGQIADPVIFSARGAGYAGEASGITQNVGDVKLPANLNLVDRDGEYHFDPKDLDELGRWFDPPFVEEYSYHTRDGSYFSGVQLPVGLDTVDGKFTIWFDGTSTEVNEGEFFSFRDHFSGGGNLVNSFRITGIGPAVDAADSEAFPVRLAFWDGSDPLTAASFSIRPAVRYQVDGLVSAKPSVSAAKGDGVYNRSGAGQTVKVIARNSRGVRAYLGIQNDGEGEDRFRLKGTRGNRSLKVSYISGGNRTALVTRGKFRTDALDPGNYEVVRIDLKPLSGRVKKKLSLLSTSAGDTTKSDLVKILFKR
ncbi:MAG: hypothetical protein KDN18_02635 [Verrucomicrobiae bacterium]|nr:hypothetical protein [Verrucomicrobiae bacterium]